MAIQVGQWVKVYYETGGLLVEQAKGFVKSLGNKEITIQTEGGWCSKFPLKFAVLEKVEADGNDHAHCHPGAQQAIKNTATGNGFVNMGNNKAHFQKRTQWESTRDFELDATKSNPVDWLSCT